jgi:hypothetical protein
MELLDRIRSTQRPLAEIRSQTREIYDTLLAASPRIAEGNFTSVHSEDLETLFELYDELFFDGQLEPATRADGAPLSFRLSKRMTRVGGTTTKYRHQRTVGPQKMSYEIAISSTLLFSTFYDVERPVSVTGVECRDRLECLQRIFEHELIHLTEMVIWDDSSCSKERFQSLAFQLFGHTEATHQLITPDERAVLKFGVRPGDRVRFQFEGALREGIVNRITKRATVLVEDAGGPLYSDGKRYVKFYVPLAILEPLGRAG